MPFIQTNNFSQTNSSCYNLNLMTSEEYSFVRQNLVPFKVAENERKHFSSSSSSEEKVREICEKNVSYWEVYGNDQTTYIIKPRYIFASRYHFARTKCHMILVPLYTTDVPNKNRGPCKVRGALLPQEYNLAHVIEDLENPHPSWSTSSHACMWKGIRCETEKVSVILWHGMKLSGHLKFNWLPRTLVDIYMRSNRLSGSVHLSSLPASLKILSLSQNSFTETLDFSQLPGNLQVIDLGHNQFEGNVELGSFPLTLTELDVSHNKLSGSVYFSSLPPGINLMYLEHNRFTGTPDLEHLSSSLEEITINNNSFSGILQLDMLRLDTMALNVLWLHNNPELHMNNNVFWEKLSNKLSDFQYDDTQLLPES